MLLKIDDRNVSDLRKDLWKFATGSNKLGRHHSINWRLLAGKRSQCELVIRRGEETLTVEVKRHDREAISNANLKQVDPPWTVIEKDIGHVDMADFKKEHIHDAMKAFRETRGIIFDMRCYPEFILYDLLPYLSPKAKPFAKFTQPDILRPGIFTATQPIEIGPKQGLLSLFASAPDAYPGKIVILVDETTISRAEFVTMALQTAPHATVIGSQTAGADGNVSQIVLPGGMWTSFSGIGVFYPDGRETQRVGIVPDIEIRSTVRGIQRGEDEILTRAVRFLKQGE